MSSIASQGGPHSASSPLSLQGSAAYAPEKAALVWKIKNFPGGREFLLRCKFGLPSVAAEEESQGRLPPIKVKFEVSGRGVREGIGRAGGRATMGLSKEHLAGSPHPDMPADVRSHAALPLRPADPLL
jgi:hypothetical protein